jgi:hypothetical protein
VLKEVYGWLCLLFKNEFFITWDSGKEQLTLVKARKTILYGQAVQCQATIFICSRRSIQLGFAHVVKPPQLQLPKPMTR